MILPTQTRVTKCNYILSARALHIAISKVIRPCVLRRVAAFGALAFGLKLTRTEK